MGMKHTIIERLLTEGHIIIEVADKILNNKSGKVQYISDLVYDSIITNSEAITLLRDNEAPTFYVPNQTVPIMPLTYTNNPFNIPGTNDPMTPLWTVTSTCDINKDFTEK